MEEKPFDLRVQSQCFDEKVLERDVLLCADAAYGSGYSESCLNSQRGAPYRGGSSVDDIRDIAEEDKTPDHASTHQIGDNQPVFRWPWNRHPVSQVISQADLCACITKGVMVSLEHKRNRHSATGGVIHRAADNVRETARETLRHIRYDLNAVVEEKFREKGAPPFNFAAYSPRRFRRLREIFCTTEEEFLESLCGAALLSGTTSGGKSFAQFWFSHDRRYILKSLTHEEAHTLGALLPDYIKHFHENPNSLLGRFYGMYKVTIQESMTFRFVVMINVFCGHPVDRMFDLKGTTEDRLVNQVESHQTVMMKDLNFKESLCMAPEVADLLVETIRSDVDFLNHHGLMDYSLIVGIRELEGEAEHPQPLDTDIPFHAFHGGIQGWAWEEGSTHAKSLVYSLGIIDFLQEWTGWKTAAHCMKKVTIGCCHEIDTEPPKVYRDRFLRYITSKTMKVPTFRKIFEENAQMKARIAYLEDQYRQLSKEKAPQGQESDPGEIVVSDT
eukprot:GEMP01024207.1.p1 GENE.GEMP01024207.1~~GEMP01024207.1.p1  ORF type:complete len:500 (+),score=76.50 GEMP01024207.1:352-1851(+)